MFVSVTLICQWCSHDVKVTGVRLPIRNDIIHENWPTVTYCFNDHVSSLLLMQYVCGPNLQ